MKTENPPKLWAFKILGQLAAYETSEAADRSRSSTVAQVYTNPQAYVREDVAALNTASTPMAADAEIDTLSTQSAALAIANMELMDERDALRRERDAVVETTLTAMLEELRKRGWECPGGLDGDDHAVCASRVRQALTAK